MMLWMVCHRRMAMIVPELMHPIVQGAMRRLQNQAHTLVSSVLGTRAHRVKVGQGPFDLFEDGDGISRSEQRRSLNNDHHR